MLQREISRKEFLTFLGLLLLHRLPLGRGASKTFAKLTPGSYGNDVYGGSKMR